MSDELQKWIAAAKYIPDVMRDFHDQKDLFKTIHATINTEKCQYVKDISWISGQCYVVDIFLYYMAKRGYTLQKSRAKLPFRNLQEDVSNCKEAYDKAFAEYMKNYFQAASGDRTALGSDGRKLETNR